MMVKRFNHVLFSFYSTSTSHSVSCAFCIRLTGKPIICSNQISIEGASKLTSAKPIQILMTPLIDSDSDIEKHIEEEFSMRTGEKEKKDLGRT